MPDISVIIPAYNRAGLIGDTLRSLLNQTVPAKEIIVVDDGSTDSTVEAIEHEFSVFREECSRNSKANIQNPRLKILRQANAGPGAARNRGLAEATGEFIHFFDSDDIASQNKQEVQLQALIKTGADIAYGPWCKGSFLPKCENGRELPDFFAKGPVLQSSGLPDGDLVRALLTNWSVIPHACLFRRSILEKAAGFPEDIWVGEDQLLFLRCLLAGAKVAHTPETMVYYRVGDDLGKLTATGAAQKRHARDWGMFLLKASQELTSGEWCMMRKKTFLTTECTTELARNSENTSPTRSASDPATIYMLPNATTPSAWFGFRMRAYEAWRDLEKFFPDGEDELKIRLLGIWKRNAFSVFSFRFLGFGIRKLGGLKLRVLGYREGRAFRCGRSRKGIVNSK